MYIYIFPSLPLLIYILYFTLHKTLIGYAMTMVPLTLCIENFESSTLHIVPNCPLFCPFRLYVYPCALPCSSASWQIMIDMTPRQCVSPFSCQLCLQTQTGPHLFIEVQKWVKRNLFSSFLFLFSSLLSSFFSLPLSLLPSPSLPTSLTLFLSLSFPPPLFHTHPSLLSRTLYPPQLYISSFLPFLFFFLSPPHLCLHHTIYFKLLFSNLPCPLPSSPVPFPSETQHPASPVVCFSVSP